jgi:Ca-activated chloride channel family protein
VIQRNLLAVLVLAAAFPARALEISIVAPKANEAVFDTVHVIVAVRGGDATSVAVTVDGRLAVVLEVPPWEADVDVGSYNAEHRFSVVATGVEGTRSAARLITPRVEVNDGISVDLRQLYVAAEDEHGAVLDLRREDFEILDEGELQRLVSFERGDIPFTAVVLADSSSSMVGTKLQTALAGAERFISAMAPLDEANLVVFSDRVLLSTPFMSAGAVTHASLDDVRAEGGTAVNDHLYLATKLLEERQGRRTIILLSDGRDVHSVLAMSEVLDAIRHSQVLLYWIRLVPAEHGAEASSAAVRRLSFWRSEREAADEQRGLVEAVETSGGRILEVSLPVDVEPAFQRVLMELRQQYVLGYYPSVVRHDGRWHTVEVRVRRPGIAPWRRGYFDY